MSLANSLDNVTNEIRNAIQDQGVLIFWNHQLEKFVWFRMEDNATYHIELQHLRRQLRTGIIATVSAGEPLMIDGTQLHAIEVNFATAQCVPNSLLRRRGNVEDAAITPYFFKSKNARDNAVRYILN